MKKCILFCAACIGLCVAGTGFLFKKKPDRYFHWYKTLYQWILVKQENIRITDYFKNKNYRRVALYGMGELGKLFLRELRNGEVEIPFTIDQSAGSITDSGVKIVTLGQAEEDVDVIVVTVVDKFDAIKSDIEKYMDVPVVSLEDILFSL